ncbi:MAG: phosphatase PAP2 family protein [Clostridia bacterium]|nr:phosphatase PAP2 family protein [Clostridia bacterium]
MNKKTATAIIFLFLFIVLTATLHFVDVQPIGPLDSSVGFASLNGAFHGITGENLFLYELTDILEIIPFLAVFGFGLLGLIQLIKRKSLLKVDPDILLLGCLYAAVGIVFVFFELYEVNYRPVLIEGVLETSYPSSTTMLVITVMSAAAIQLNKRIKNRALMICSVVFCIVYTVFMVAARLISGVHWLTDITGGILVSAGLVFLYAGLCDRFCKGKTENE